MKYQIWDKISDVITPTMEVFTPVQWAERYPAANIDGIDLVIAAGNINGAFCQEYTSFISFYENDVDFSQCETRQECIDLINEFEIQRQQAMNQQAQEAANTPSTDERIAAALEAQVMMSLSDSEEV